MGYAVTRTVTLDGIAGHLVDVQADVTQGLVSTTLVGRPDPSVAEARERCRAAVRNSGFSWPNTRRVTVLLSPAELPKRGPHLDLAIALSVLAAADLADLVEPLARCVVLGELALDGGLRSMTGVVPMVLAARAAGHRRVLLPETHVAEATLVPGTEVLGVRSLAQAVAVLLGQEVPDASPVPPLGSPAVLHPRPAGSGEELDLADVLGLPDAKLALEVAAAGGHHLLLSGPKGAGKTTLAERLPGLLPDLGTEQALELVAVHSLAGDAARRPADRRPPFRAPHHSASAASVLGGGSGRVRPGELSRALHGVLFLDEFPLFRSDIIEALRQPLESGEVTIARGEEVATLPARTVVLLAANPCPCGGYRADPSADRCTCGEVRRRSYRERLSGPVLDRIDLVRHVTPVSPWQAGDPFAPREDSAAVRERVAEAHRRQAERLAGTPWRLHGHVPGPVLTSRWPLPDAGLRRAEEQVRAGRLTRRGLTRVHRVAWTLADLRAELRGPDGPTEVAVDLALRLRSGDPLPVLPGIAS